MKVIVTYVTYAGIASTYIVYGIPTIESDGPQPLSSFLSLMTGSLPYACMARHNETMAQRPEDYIHRARPNEVESKGSYDPPITFRILGGR